VSQPLIYPLPSASACYPVSSPSGNCTDVQLNQEKSSWRADRPGSLDMANFETFIFNNGSISACYMNTSLAPCEQGNVPVIGVDARSISDVQAAVKFAVTYNLRLVIKNTGHDFIGRSAGRGGFMLWTHHLQNITYNPTFVPHGGPASEIYNAITLEAGVLWNDAYDAAHAHGRVLIGGLSAEGTVGAAGGWLQGGGHGVTSPRYGLGVDNVIEMGVVTSAGEYLIVNSHQHSDLFWALRGGGPSTYGVVTSVTYRTHESVPFTVISYESKSSNTNTLRKIFREFIRIHPSLSDAEFGGYGSISNTSLSGLFAISNASETVTNRSLNPFFEYAENLTSQEGPNLTTMATGSFDSFYGFYQEYFASAQDIEGASIEIASRLVPRKSFENDYERLTDTLFDLNGISWNYVAGGAVSKVDPESTGLNPAWRDCLWEVTFGTVWSEGAPSSEIKRLRAELAATLKTISDIMPDTGSYVNEGWAFEPDPKYTYYGSHYDTLKAIKDLYDPLGLFVVTVGVGSEEWDQDLNCRR